MDVTRERLYVFDRRRRQDAVAEIEDMPGTAGGAREDVVRRGKHAVERAEQERRIEVALDAAVRANPLPRLVERRAPVGADDVAAGVAQIAENRPGADAEMNCRNAGRRD